MENKNVAENEVVNKGKIPAKTTPEGNTKPITLTVKLTAEENSRFTVNLERLGMISKTDYVKHRLFNNKPIITLKEGHEIFEELSKCIDILHNLSEGNSVDRQQDINELNERFGKIEANISYTWDCIDALNNGKEMD